MAIYIDNVRVKHRGHEWCHMVADSLDELHQFAKLLELGSRYFHKDASYPHYDITVAMRSRALEIGAKEGTRKEIIGRAKRLKKEQLSQMNTMDNYEIQLSNP